MLHQRGRINLGPEPSRTLEMLLDQSGFVTQDLTREIAVLSRTLTFFHGDPADRFIAATAYALGQRLATDDINLRKIPWLILA
jgi:PIN domain nuclease of toxin-antitoxin system